MKCLIVEDAAFLREVYYYSLRDTSYQIIGDAKDGDEALEKIKLFKPQIIILDLVLPIKNGYEVLKQIPTISPESRVLVISSLDDPNDISKAKGLGAIEYLTKPFTKKQLITALEMISQSYGKVQNG